MNSQQMMEEIDRLTRLCKAKDAEIERLAEQLYDSIPKTEANVQYANVSNELRNKFQQKLSEAQAQIAMLASQLIQAGDCIHDIGSGKGGWAWEEVLGEIQEALSATSETVAAWRAKETEPLRIDNEELSATQQKLEAAESKSKAVPEDALKFIEMWSGESKHALTQHDQGARWACIELKLMLAAAPQPETDRGSNE